MKKLNNAPPKGIIQRMKHFLEMYELVKWVDKEIDDNNALDPNIVGLDVSYVITTWGIIQKYQKESKQTKEEILSTEQKTQKMVWECIENGYLKKVSESGRDISIKVDSVKGRKLISGGLGFIESFLNMYDRSTAIIFSLIAGGFLWNLIQYLIRIFG